MKHTDRWAWSSKDGKKHLPKQSFQLPSVEWIWEGDWHIDHGLEGDNEVIMNMKPWSEQIYTSDM